MRPLRVGGRDRFGQSIGELATYVHRNEFGYGGPEARLWFSPGGRYPLAYVKGKAEERLTEQQFDAFEDLVKAVITQLGLDWDDVQKVKL